MSCRKAGASSPRPGRPVVSDAGRGGGADGVAGGYHGAVPGEGAAGAGATKRGSRGRLGTGLVIVTGWSLIAVTAFTLASAVVDQRRQTLEGHAVAEARIIAGARSSLLATWLDGFSRLAQRITRSELVQLYADGRSGVADGEPAGWLAGQQPFLRQMLGDFVTQHDLLGASLLTPDGAALLAVGDVPRSPASSRARASGGATVVTPFQELTTSARVRPVLAFQIATPVPRPAASGGEGIAGIFVMTVPAVPAVIDLLSEEGPEGLPPAMIRQADGSRVTVRAARIDLDALSAGPEMPVSLPVDGTDWTVEQSPVEIGGAVRQFQENVHLVAGGVGACFGLAFALLCMMLDYRRRRVEAQADAAAAEHDERFRHLFENLAGTAGDAVGPGDDEGRHGDVDRVSGEPLGRSAEETVGRPDTDLAAAEGVEDALPRYEPQDGVAALPPAGSHCRDMALVAPHPVVNAPARADAAPPSAGSGMLTIDQAVGVLTRAVGLRDPFLKGHGDRVAELAGTVARRLGLTEEECRTIDLAARLSQVGKIFIPDDILTKPGRHDPEEMAVMRTHVARALDVLEPIDFGLPVAEALGQMQERLDGTGYPDGLSGEAVGMPARVLAVVDVFCARTSARSYRDQVTPGQALFYLAGHPDRYDQRVVTELVSAVSDGGGRLALPAPRATALEGEPTAA